MRRRNWERSITASAARGEYLCPTWYASAISYRGNRVQRSRLPAENEEPVELIWQASLRVSTDVSSARVDSESPVPPEPHRSDDADDDRAVRRSREIRSADAPNSWHPEGQKSGMRTSTSPSLRHSTYNKALFL